MTEANHTITLSPETLQKLSETVQLPNAAALNEFVADAINTYSHLGRLHQSGGRFLFEAEGREEPIVLHFPFQPNPEETSAS